MKRSLPILIVLSAAFLACVAGLFAMKDSLSPEALRTGRVFRNPAEAPFELRFPTAAFPMPDGGFVVLDDEGRRLVGMDAQAVYRWSIGGDDNFGSFLSVDADDEGRLYVMDTGVAAPKAPAGDSGGKRWERIVRVERDGSPAGVLVQKSFSGSGGFVRGSLRVADSSVWYLFADDEGLVSLARTGLADGRERVLVKTEWAVTRASLAVKGQDVWVSVGGGIVRWSAGRFEALSEHADALPYPGELRRGPDGAVYVSDPSIGALARLADDGGFSLILDAVGLGQASVRPTGIVFDSFYINAAGITIVDEGSSMIMSVQPDGRVSRLIRAVTLPEARVRAERQAWLLAGAGAALALGLLAFGIAALAARGPAVLGAAALGLPILALALAGGLILGSSAARRERAAFEEASLSRLRAAAVAGAAAIDPAPLASVDKPGDYGSKPWEAIRATLLSIAEKSPSDGNLPMYALLYRERNGALRFVCDARGDYRPGLPQRYAFPEYRRVLREGSPDTGLIRDPSGEWLAAMAPVKDAEGAVAALLELSVPFLPPEARALSPLSLGFALLAYAVSCVGLYFPLARRRKRLDDEAAREREEAAEAGGQAAGEANRAEAPAAGPESHEAGPDHPEAGPGKTSPDGREGPGPRTDGQPPSAQPSRESPPATAGAEPARDRAARLAAAHRRAIEALKAGDARAAVVLLEDFLREEPRNLAALNNLGIAYKRAGRAADAVACLERCLALDPGNAQARRNLELLRGGNPSGR